jgi:multidrug resistance efflux pump
MTPIQDRSYYQKLRASDYGVADAVRTVRRHDHFVKDLRARVAQDKKRSKAAKKGWKTRRANHKGI